MWPFKKPDVIEHRLKVRLKVNASGRYALPLRGNVGVLRRGAWLIAEINRDGSMSKKPAYWISEFNRNWSNHGYAELSAWMVGSEVCKDLRIHRLCFNAVPPPDCSHAIVMARGAWDVRVGG